MRVFVKFVVETYGDLTVIFNTFNFVFRFQWTLIQQTKCKGSWRKLKKKKVFQFIIKELYLIENSYSVKRHYNTTIFKKEI
uniref:Uncharacterized protein n=1 Tax=Trichogramma kaykai TaxID=54128 RepID=A0ABD2X4G9_9HYME